MTKKRIFWIAGILLTAVIVITVLSSGNDDNEAVEVETAKVERQKIVETVSATGEIQPETQVKISADVAGKILQLTVNEGDWVEKGKLLVQLDRENYLAAVESAEANLRATEANANLVKENMIRFEKDYNRIKELFEKQLESQASMDQARAAYKVEAARYQSNLEQVDQARASLKQARDALSKTTIYAPMAGTISELNKELGEIALGSQFQEDVILIISNLNSMEAVVDVDENDIVSVMLGDNSTIEVDALSAKAFEGTVSEIASSANVTAAGSADQKTEFEVKIRITNPDNSLRPGMTASAEIVTEVQEDAIVVPIQSVTVRTSEQLAQNEAEGDTSKARYTPDKDGFVPVVFVLRGDEVMAEQVETGIQSETHIEILNGLSEGDEIVTGNYRAISQILQNNTKVEVSGGEKGGSSSALAAGN